jgi:hypothetical protein
VELLVIAHVLTVAVTSARINNTHLLFAGTEYWMTVAADWDSDNGDHHDRHWTRPDGTGLNPTMPVNSILSCDDFPQRYCVHAIAQAAWGRAIREHVAQVCVTGVADRLDALQERGPVEPVGNHIVFDGLGK